ncbi:FkbM family methyltransferase [Candidatus Kaiserbacteria bacterium]|nr:FkbM family methyltransferase [Candidatus Kaiserbacteria bacterium]
MKRIQEYIKDVVLILTNKHRSVGEKARLFYYYTKISVLNFLNNKIINPKEVTFLSFKVRFVSFSEFFMLVREIFVYEPYYFNSEKENPLVFDCGGNIGLATLYFKFLYPKARIVVFEPVPDIYKILKKNIEINNLSSVEVHNLALSDKESEDYIYVRDSMTLASTMSKEEAHGGKKIKINTSTLSKFINTEVDFLKMDIQLSEYRSISDLAKNGVLRNIKEAIIEFHYLFGYKENLFSKVLEIFEENSMHYKVSFNGEKPGMFITYLVRFFRQPK